MGGVGALLLVGATTGRDGIQGASFASATLDEGSEERRPAVQVGNPFLEKLLMEACLELARMDAVVAMQDLGAAGLTCALAELTARGGVGAEVDLAVAQEREGFMRNEWTDSTPFVLNGGRPTGYGYGLMIGEVRDRRAISHGGGIFGFSAGLVSGIRVLTVR